MAYVDGFVLPVPKDRLADYETVAKAAALIWKEHGAIGYWECVGDDLESDCTRTFTDMTQATADETVVFAWAVFESRAARDAANAKIQSDPRMFKHLKTLTPFLNFQRMAQGGFNTIVAD